MEKIFTCIKNIGVWHSFEKMKPQLCFFLKKTRFTTEIIPDILPKPSMRQDSDSDEDPYEGISVAWKKPQVVKPKVYIDNTYKIHACRCISAIKVWLAE